MATTFVSTEVKIRKGGKAVQNSPVAPYQTIGQEHSSLVATWLLDCETDRLIVAKENLSDAMKNET